MARSSEVVRPSYMLDSLQSRWSLPYPGLNTQRFPHQRGYSCPVQIVRPVKSRQVALTREQSALMANHFSSAIESSRARLAVAVANLQNACFLLTANRNLSL